MSPAGAGSGTATTVRVGEGSTGYDVLIGNGLLDQLPGLLGPGVRRACLVHSRALRAPAAAVAETLAGAGVRVLDTEVPDGEPAKTVEVLAGCWARLGQAGFTRSDAVVGLGGGSVTDLAGFAAASWLRGVPVVQVPTTLLGMVDAAIGGKTGINTAEGKNLVGAFHPPRAVVCDLTALRTLPHADLVAGLAEVVKCGFIADPAILEALEADPHTALAWDSPVLRELVERSVAVKADVVTQDLRENGVREVLNFGHTFGHAIEQVEGFGRRHGEAVAVGMAYAGELGRLAGRTPPELVARIRQVSASLGLPTGYRGDRWPALLAAMGRDKKNRGDLARFVVLDGLARPGRLEAPAAELAGLMQEAYTLVSI